MEQGMDAAAAPQRRSWMRRAVRALLWALLAMAALLALVAAVVLWMNRRDEAPSEDVRALQALLASAKPVAGEDDALAGITALGALRTRSPDASLTGAAMRRNSAEERASRGDAVDAALRSCESPDGACTALLAAAEPELAGWIERERALLDGYIALLPRRGWYEPLPPARLEAFELSAFGAVTEAQRLLHAQALIDARAGRVDAVRDALAADLGFWRAALAGSRTLIARMVAARAVQRNFEAGAHALARLPDGAVDSVVPAGWRVPITPQERSLHAALAWEWQLGDNAVRSVYGDQSKALRQREPRASLTPLFKLQATSNANAAMMRRAAQAYDVPYPRLRESLRRLDADVERQARWPISLYNPIGRILGAIAAPALTGYGQRLADLEGQRRALLAVVELHRHRTGAAQVPARLADSALRDPYTGAAFEWDAGASCVRARGLDRSHGRRCLHYGVAPAIQPSMNP